MATSTLDQVIHAIKQAEEKKNPAELFLTMPEQMIWSNAKSILDNVALSDVGSMLLRSIYDAFVSIHDRDSVCALLIHILAFTTDSLLYQTAQHTILRYAKEWERKCARQLYTSFEESYRHQVEDGDAFIARLSLEGAVLLPLFRAEKGLQHRALSLLVEEFPPLPGEPSNPAYLPVKAIKLLGQCYDCFPKDDSILQKIQECLQCSNYAISAEARFVSGIISLYDAFSASDESAFLLALEQAAKHFTTAIISEESRTDAELFATITQCYLLLLQSSSFEKVRETVSSAEEIVTERLLMFGDLERSDPNWVEFRLVQLLTHLAHWTEALSAPTKWAELQPSLLLLADIYTSVREADVYPFLSNVSETTQRFVMLPYLHGRFVQIQEIVSKMTSILSDQNWEEQTSASERAFCELVLQMLQETPSPKAWAATELEKVRVAAENDNPAFAEFIATFQQSGKDSADGFIQLAWHYLRQEHSTFSPEFPLYEGPAQEICEHIIPILREQLGWNTSTPKWKFLLYSVRLTIAYLIRIYRITPGEAAPEDVSFLFAEGIEGLHGRGQNVTEKDLENHFYRTMYIANFIGSIERQSMSIAPGRPDLNFRFQGDIIFPIEIKRELKDISYSYIHEHYVAQAQSYAGSLHGVSFLFILDLTPKPLKIPLRSVVDCCYVDHRSVPHSTRQDYVIIVVIPANRLRPSDHSWKTSRRRTHS